jgi:hypothetical protein
MLKKMVEQLQHCYLIAPARFSSVVICQLSCFYVVLCAGFHERCWVAAWGQTLERQREVDLPLLSSQECTDQLGPVFASKES